MKAAIKGARPMEKTHNDGALAPSAVPVTGDIADPVALAPDTRSD